MISAGSVSGRETARIFLGLRIPGEVVEPLAAWQRAALRGRLVPAENLHVTLAFLGG